MGGRGGGSSLASKAAAPSVVPPVAQSGDVALDAVRDAIAAETNKATTTMEMVRNRLAGHGMSRDEQDAQLLRLFRSRQIVLAPVTNQKTMTQAQRDARIFVGGEFKGLVMMA